MPDDENDRAVHGIPSGPEPHGHAALLLVESLIHGLCAKFVLSVEEAIEIVERAADVQSETAEAADGAGAALWRSHALLSAIAMSLRIDEKAPLPPRPAA